MLARLVLEFVLFVLLARGLTALTLWGVARFGAQRARWLTPAGSRSSPVKPFLAGYKRPDAFPRSV